MKTAKKRMLHFNLGQLRTLRKFLGMTQAQLGKRAITSQQAVAQLELGKGDPRLLTLKKIAKALECELKIEFVPKDKIKKLKEEQALKKAKTIVGLSAASSALENQVPSREIIKQKIEEVAKRLINKKGKKLWD